jgi:hypothetical protein
MHDVCLCLGHRAHVQEELLVPWAVPVLGTPGGKWSLYLWPRDQKSNQNTPNGAEWRGLMSKTFLVAGLTDLGGFGRYLGPKQGKSKCFQRIRKIG